MSTPRPASASNSSPWLRLSAALTLVVAVTVLAVAVGTFAQLHGTFSLGVGAMLALYGLALATLGWLTWRGVTALNGLVIAAAVLHVMVAVSLALNGAPWMWATLPIFAATALAAVRVRLASLS